LQSCASLEEYYLQQVRGNNKDIADIINVVNNANAGDLNNAGIINDENNDASNGGAAV